LRSTSAQRFDENGKNSGTAGSPQIGHFVGGRSAFLPERVVSAGCLPAAEARFDFAAFTMTAVPSAVVLSWLTFVSRLSVWLTFSLICSG
jgi:hypothetical protein